MIDEERSEIEDWIDRQAEDALDKALPDGLDLGPTHCAVCGQHMSRVDEPDQAIPVRIPPATTPLLDNSQAIELTESTVSLSLRFCNEHWSAIVDVIGQPGAISFSSFDGRYVQVDELPEGKRPFLDTSPAQDRWGQNPLRVARMRLSDSFEDIDFEGESTYSQVQETLLVSAVDGYQIDYGPVEQAKEQLIPALRQVDIDGRRLRHPFLDVEIELETESEKIVGTVFVVNQNQSSLQSGPLSSWEADPERIVSNTTFLRLPNQSYFEYAAKEWPETQYIAFYWLPKAERWHWYPFKKDYDTGFSSDDRQLLPIDGPTETPPAPPLSELNEETCEPAGFEDRLSERWEEINQNRPAVDRFRDGIYRRFN